ncbi:helix-turn-helix domain-containing protein [Fulvivirga sp. 29W222]|uniref:Helix-turn-helix domain-containing protein n=1 Tax=Fulvivirga marina TaxID=2494733 RepID=A0A937FVB0_9BACT|nr:helix-turn-helix transcriptional regulator [Fulvivirga marina]MBL6446619.1 helix-turn-helix domain-containing protein [Fulvivirga marina]
METIFDNTEGKTTEPHRHDFYTIVWVQHGNGFHLIDFNTYDIEDNQVFFISPGQIHQVHTPKRPQGWVITFSADFLSASGISQDFILKINLFKSYSDSPPIYLDDKTRATLEVIIKSLYVSYKEENAYKEEAVGAWLKLFLIECVSLCEKSQPPEVSATSCVLIDFRKMVEKNFRKLHKVSEYAGLLFLTPKHLNQVVKNTIGCTAKDYIIDRIISEAKRLLIHTHETVKQIAITLGFKEPLHFNSFFKKKVGLTPLEFRKQYTISNS